MSRRVNAGAQRRAGFRGFGADTPSALGLALTGGADILGGATFWNNTILGVLVRWVPIALPANSTLSIAMTGDFASAFNLITTTWTSGLVGATVAFNGAYSTSPTNGVDVHQPGAVGRMHTSFVRLVSGASIQHWFDGEQVGLSGATVATSLGSASNLAINRRVSADSLPYGSMGFIEIRATTAALTDAQIRAACLAPVGTALPSGEVNAIVASDIIGTSIAPRVGGGTYAVTGSPPLTSYRIAPKGLGTIEVTSDSRGAGRNVATLLNAGYRREAGQIVNQSRHVTWNGQFPYTDPATVLDFSPYHSGVGGMGLGATPGAGATKLDTVATDRGLSGGPDSINLLDIGVNDIYRRTRSTELAQTPAAAYAAMQTDWATYLAAWRVARNGPVVCATIPRSSDGTTEANQITTFGLWNAGAAANVASWSGTYGKVYLWDAEAALIAAYGSTYYNNAAVEFDGLHYTPAAYTVLANSLASFLLTLP